MPATVREALAIGLPSITRTREMRVWSNRRTLSVTRSTYYGSALFVAFSLIVLGTAYVLNNMRVFVACFSVGAAVIAVTCYIALVSTISKRAERSNVDIGAPCGESKRHVVGVCPDTHEERDGRCIKRTSRLVTGGQEYELDASVESEAIRNYLNVTDLKGMDTETVSNMCKAFSGRPYTALNALGRECTLEPRHESQVV